MDRSQRSALGQCDTAAGQRLGPGDTPAAPSALRRCADLPQPAMRSVQAAAQLIRRSSPLASTNVVC